MFRRERASDRSGIVRSPKIAHSLEVAVPPPPATVIRVSREPLRVRALRFGRDMVVGSGATTVDFLFLTFLIRGFDIVPTVARLPALMAGATVQFFGSRSFTFKAQSGSMCRQAMLFMACEAAGIAINFCLFHVLQPHITFVPPEIVSFMVNAIVTVTWAYPMRKLVIFRLREAVLPVRVEEPGEGPSP